MPENVHLSIVADFDNLATVKAFVSRRAKELAVPDRLWSKLELVVEELFLNIVNHSCPTPKTSADISCSWQNVGQKADEMFCVSVRDWGPPFNPLENDSPALEQKVESRPIGGLGIFLVLQMADHCSYTREDDNNIFSACFQMK
ncbi:MAG: ATP-binding protein [Desulfobulbaceae bacterium]|nr:ATP-binding protein [Desulfobulbaceae bacterium]